MKLKTVDGNELGLFLELRKEGSIKTTESVGHAEVHVLKAEIERREKVLPFVRLADRIVEEMIQQAGKIDEEQRLVYEREFDVLGRPNVWMGFNASERTLEEIVTEDKNIKEGLLPRRKPGESKMVWTERLVVNEKTGVVAPYASYGTEYDQNRCIVDFVIRVKATKD